MAKAPYNFVPLSDKIYYPEWSGFTTIDIPFVNGVSGRIEYTLTARTPIFVRNGGAKQKEETRPTSEFSEFNNKYFIPATSIKGCMRNALTIISFGKFSTRYDDKGYKLRDEDGSKRDLAETIFGAVDDLSLKGRVQFSHCLVLVNKFTVSAPAYLNLNTPHPEIHSLYGNSDNRPKGRKRYVMKDSVDDNNRRRKDGNTISELHPLNVNSTFKGVIFFHNLLPIELGALLSALTFFGAEDKFCHQIGQGKPFGYGRVSLTLDKLFVQGQICNDYYNYIDTFISHMRQNGFSLAEDNSIREYLTLCSNYFETKNVRFQYMSRNDNDTSSSLPYLSEIITEMNRPNKNKYRISTFPIRDVVLAYIKQKTNITNVPDVTEENNEKVQLIERIKELIQKGKEYQEENNPAEALKVYDEIIKLWEGSKVEDFADSDLKNSYSIIANTAVQLSKLSKEKETLDAFIKRCASPNNLYETLKKRYLPLSKDDQSLVLNKLCCLFQRMDTRERKKEMGNLIKRISNLGVDDATQKEWITTIQSICKG